MSDIKSLLVAAEAQTMVDAGAIWVDVRSEVEFEAGHPPTALNVPLMHQGPAGMQPNPEFLEVMQNCFGAREKLVLFCRSGKRSRRAAELLAKEGFADLTDFVPGFEGSRDAFGRPLVGWRQSQLSIETGRLSGQTYSDVRKRKPPKEGQGR